MRKYRHCFRFFLHVLRKRTAVPFSCFVFSIKVCKNIEKSLVFFKKMQYNERMNAYK
jgi:hypothetical protein